MLSVFVSCPSELIPSDVCTDLSIPQINQMIELPAGYLGSCGQQSGVGNTRGVFKWVVQSINCQGDVDDLASWDDDGTSNDFISNDDRAGSGSLMRVIRVPEEGTFLIRVEIEFEDCTNCCSTEFSNSLGRTPCTQSTVRGFPVYSSFTTLFNQTASVSPIRIFVEIFSCLNCGIC